MVFAGYGHLLEEVDDFSTRHLFALFDQGFRLLRGIIRLDRLYAWQEFSFRGLIFRTILKYTRFTV
jgi:hypothetical protein